MRGEFCGEFSINDVNCHILRFYWKKPIQLRCEGKISIIYSKVCVYLISTSPFIVAQYSKVSTVITQQKLNAFLILLISFDKNSCIFLLSFSFHETSTSYITKTKNPRDSNFQHCSISIFNRVKSSVAFTMMLKKVMPKSTLLIRCEKKKKAENGKSPKSILAFASLMYLALTRFACLRW